MTKNKVSKLFFSIVINLVIAASAEAAIFPIGWGPASKKPIPQAMDQSFPHLKGMNLEGDKIFLPEGLEGKLNLVVIAFKRKQQEDVNTWIEALEGFVDQHKDLELYELPVLKKFNIFTRLSINNGMRYGIGSKESREKTITIYLDKESFKSRLAIANEDSILVLLMNQQGQIFWRQEGRANKEGIEDLLSKLKLRY